MEKAEEEAKIAVPSDSSKPTPTAASGAQVQLPEGTSSSVHKFLTDDYNEEEEGGDADILKGDEDQVGTKVNNKTRTTVRNLRIREDTAKYLLNLDPDSAYYDAKSRSMRGNPLPFKDPSEVEFAGENFVRHTGEAQEFARIQAYAFEANEKGQAVTSKHIETIKRASSESNNCLCNFNHGL